MPLSAPLYHLKRQAKLLSRKEQIPLHEALNRIAAHEGFRNWSMLAAHASSLSPARKFYHRMVSGDMVLVGARPGQGKTLFSLELAVEAMKLGHHGAFFTLEYTEKELHECFHTLGVEWTHFTNLFEFDSSDSICADYIVKKLAAAPRNTVVVIDYLQQLDHKRENPELRSQVQTLAGFARERGLIFVFISQIHRSFDSLQKPCPDLQDVRLPNPLDLKLFNKTCFLNNGEVIFR